MGAQLLVAPSKVLPGITIDIAESPTRPFFLPPDDPRFDQILTQVKRERDARIARLRRDKKRLALAKQQRRSRLQKIDELPRAKEALYPPVMREIFGATAMTR
jgi:hypothetical protein